MRKLGVVGNREGFSYMEVRHELDKIIKVDTILTIVTGGANGVDTHAMRYAQERGLCLIVFYPDLSLGCPKCYFKRNDEIVKCLLDGNKDNILIAFNKKSHSGSLNTINTAKRHGVKVKIITGEK